MLYVFGNYAIILFDKLCLRLRTTTFCTYCRKIEIILRNIEIPPSEQTYWKLLRDACSHSMRRNRSSDSTSYNHTNTNISKPTESWSVKIGIQLKSTAKCPEYFVQFSSYIFLNIFNRWVQIDILETGHILFLLQLYSNALFCFMCVSIVRPWILEIVRACSSPERALTLE